MTMPHDMRAAQIIYDIAGTNPPEAGEPECCCPHCQREGINNEPCSKCADLIEAQECSRDVRELVTLARAYLDSHRGWASAFGCCVEQFPVLDGGR